MHFSVHGIPGGASQAFSHLICSLSLAEWVFLFTCVAFNRALFSPEETELKSMSRHLQKCVTSSVLNISLEQAHLLSYTLTSVLGLLKWSIYWNSQTLILCVRKALISSNLLSEASSFFKRQINFLNPSYASIHSVSITVLCSIWNLGMEECHDNGYCYSDLIGFDMLEEV